jgi:hypothetical protein
MILRLVASDDVLPMIELIRQTPIGEILPYRELSRTFKRTIRSQDSALQTALRRALRNDGIVMKAVRNVGYRRLDANGAVDEAGNVNRSIRTKVRKGLAIIDTTENANDLSPNNQVLAAIHRIRFDVIVKISNAQTTQKLTATIENPTATGDDILKAIKGTIDRLRGHYDLESIEPTKPVKTA